MKFGKFTLSRRIVALSILAVFLLQFFRIKWLVGGIIGSLVLGRLNLLDVFAFAESAISAHSLTTILLYSVLPVLILYVFVGRAFCGWICPLDLVFRGINRIRETAATSLPSTERKASAFLPSPSMGEGRERVLSAWKGYLFGAGFLIAAAIYQIPFFTSYLSPVTNFYRLFYTGFFWMRRFPAEPWVFALSALMLIGFLLLEFFQPRFWCRSLCPVGKVYGLFNRIDFLHIEMQEGKCVGCRRCEDACYMGIRILPASPKKIRDSACILCGRCVEACNNHEKILHMKFF